MEVQPPIETEHCILVNRQLISASIETEHKDNLISVVDTHNETWLLKAPNIDKEHFVLEGDDLLIHVIVACIGHIDLAFEDMSPINTYCPNDHI